MIIALLLVAAYLLGAFPSSYVVARLARGIDLRQHGSGNLGATNAFRVLGWQAATPVFILDILKGWLPTFYFPRIDQSDRWEWALAYGAAAIVGHVFSVYVRFKGGKGVATGAGVFLALAPLAVLAGLVVWATLLFLTGTVSIASIAAAAVLPLAVALLYDERLVLVLALALSIFVIFAHRANIRRLARGEEHSFRRKEAKRS
ncbi:MAG TPA: glycerol-3-phosphate 1-O-acyltransferase PlsY [Longimicrobiales bacterium]|nr:glycerol-3-phosphate 1-O-acyltransferase PlsY [Longimicrobiales bacterium]